MVGGFHQSLITSARRIPRKEVPSSRIVHTTRDPYGEGFPDAKRATLRRQAREASNGCEVAATAGVPPLRAAGTVDHANVVRERMRAGSNTMHKGTPSTCGPQGGSANHRGATSTPPGKTGSPIVYCQVPSHIPRSLKTIKRSAFVASVKWKSVCLYSVANVGIEYTSQFKPQLFCCQPPTNKI